MNRILLSLTLLAIPVALLYAVDSMPLETLPLVAVGLALYMFGGIYFAGRVLRPPR